MSNATEAKIDLIARMISSLGELTNVEARLRLAGDTALANGIGEKHDELREVIDTLRAEVADEWTADAAEIGEEISKANAKVQASIRDIQKRINVAENVVKIIGQIDNAVAAIKGLVP